MAVVSCPNCGGGMKVRDEHLGRRVVCPACKQQVVLPRTESGEPRGWHYIRDRKKFGPISFAQLKSLAERGILAPGDMVLPPGAAKWATAQTVPDLVRAPRRPAAQAPSRRRFPLLFAIAALLVTAGIGITVWATLTRPQQNAAPEQTLADANNKPPSLPEKKPLPLEEKKPAPVEEKTNPPQVEQKPKPPEEKVVPPEEKVVPPEEKKIQPPENKPPPEEKKPPPPDDFELKKIDTASSRAAWVEQLNAIRVKTGLGNVHLSNDAGDGCQAHAEYLVRNAKHASTAMNLHNEDASLPGFSAAGKTAAMRAEVALSPPETALRAWLENVEVRLKLLEPGMREIDVGLAQNRRGDWACVVSFGVERDQGIVLYPFPGQSEVRLSFSGGPEAPDTKAQLGFPISVLFPSQRKIVNAQAWLEDDKAAPVPFWLSPPEKPLRPSLSHMIGLLPKAPLTPAHVYTVKVSAEVDGKEWTRTWSFTTEDDSDAREVWAKKVLDRIREIRKEAKIGAVDLDPALSKGCRLHALYLVRNADHPAVQGLGGHDEDPKLPGYTPEGKKAGKESVIAFADPAPLDAVESWLATLYHRAPLLDPRLVRIGFGAARGKNGMWTTCVNLSGLTKGDRDRVVVYPEDGQTRVALTFPAGGEIPNPIPDDKDGKAGFPVTAIFPMRASVKSAKAKLIDAKGVDVPIWFSSPDKPANPQFSDYQGACLCIIPHDPLSPEQTYRVEMSAQVDGKAWERSWKFTTGPAGPSPREGAERMVSYLNRMRTDAGLGSVRLDAASSKGCLEHATYLALNFETIVKTRGRFNDQDASLPGATPAGREIARHSQVSLSTPHPDAIVDDALGTLSMRESMLAPKLRRIGFGCALAVGRGWMSVYSPEDDEAPALAAYPYPDQEQVGRTAISGGGVPLSVVFPEGQSPPEVRVRLLGPDAKEVPLVPHPISGKGAFVFTPPALRAGEHQVEVRYTLAGKERRHGWKFTTEP